MLVLITNRNSRKPFRLLPKSTTLHDLELVSCSGAQMMRASELTTEI